MTNFMTDFFKSLFSVLIVTLHMIWAHNDTSNVSIY